MNKFLRIITYLVSVGVCLAAVIPETCDNSEKCVDRRMHPTFDHGDQIQATTNKDELTSSYWLDNAKNFVKEQLGKEPNQNIAKNIIFFIGDGMSIATLAATRVYIGGEEKSLSFQTFPSTGVVKTYCIDRQVPDSASTATAYLSGVKGNYGTIGVNGNVMRKECSHDLAQYHTKSIAEHALDAGKDAGIVTTTRVTHASPAGVYAHIADRDWENDSKVKKDCPDSKIFAEDIAKQLIVGKVGSRLKVILGGGRREFLNDTDVDEEGMKGYRSDGENLIQSWKNNGKNNEYVWNREELLKVNPKTTNKLLGLFQTGHMLYHLEAEDLGKSKEKPTLAEMTEKAIAMLQPNEKGFFLFVEGGKIDLAHHDVYAKLALDETAELSKAVEIAMKMTNSSDTLIVVSSDHSHTMSFGGYPNRGNSIIGMAAVSNQDEKPYMTLSYANGKGFHKYFDVKTNTRLDPSTVVTNKTKMEFPSTIPIDTETHGGEDVAVFASGPWSNLFIGSYEQSHLPYLMEYAACIGDGIKACDKNIK